MRSDRLPGRHCDSGWRSEVTEQPAGCGLYVVVETGVGADERLAAALAAVDTAAVLIAPGIGRISSAADAKPLVEQTRGAGVTALILDDVEVARAAGAD